MAEREIKEGSVGIDKGQWAISLSKWMEASRAVVFIDNGLGDRGTGSIVRHRVKEEDNFYLLTANSLVRTSEEAQDCAIFFNYDDGLDSKPEDFKQKRGKALIDFKRDDDIYLRTRKQVLNYSMFPLKMEELQDVYGVKNDKIPHLTLDGGTIQNAQELYIIHHTKVEEKYRKCLNARFGIADRGPFIHHCVTTYEGSMGAPIFTVDRRAHNVPYLRFVGMQVFDTDLYKRTKFIRKLARVKGPEDTWTADVEINYGITTEVISEDVNHYNKERVNPELLATKSAASTDLIAILNEK